MADNPNWQMLGALDFLELSEQFFQAFRDLPTRPPPSWPRYLLLSHAVELALKAYLTWRGVAEVTLIKDYGHKLSKLIKDATDQGLTIDAKAREWLDLLDAPHHQMRHRYPKWTAEPLPTIEQFEPHVAALLRAVRQQVCPSGPFAGGPMMNVRVPD